MFDRSLFALFIALASLQTITPAVAGEPPSAPQLRLETGRHVALIRHVSSDAQGRWIVTNSNDKSLRLWDGQSGELLRTYRLPIGSGSEGKLFSSVMDPAGEWVATGGWTGYEWDKSNSIYILDRARGHMIKRISGLENVILNLCVSGDGHWMAASLSSGNGVRVYDARNGFREVFADRDYDGTSNGCAFSDDGGRLVTSSQDGHIRLYHQRSGRFSLSEKAKAPSGQRPYTVAFHPWGELIAAGYQDVNAVDVFDGESLRHRYSADTKGLPNSNSGSLDSVAWSSDGKRLFAGGRYDDGSGNNPALIWGNRGRGSRTAWKAGEDTLMDLKPLPDGSMLAVAADPAVIRFDTRGRRQLDLRPRTVDMRSHYEKFRINHDGSQVSFGLKYKAEDPVWFDLESRRLYRGEPNTTAQIQARLSDRGYNPGGIDGQSGPGTLDAANAFRRDQGLGGSGLDSRLQRALGITPMESRRTRADGLEIKKWRDDLAPTRNGEQIQLERYEVSRSVAVREDGWRFVIGADWSLRMFDRRGKQLWKRPVPAPAWGVNLSGDGRLVVAAFGDGTIRWYRADNGKMLLSLFVTNDGKQWVLWTPSGYYDASPGGDSLIGWHVNNGKDSVADFYSAAQMRDRFYKPGVIAHILTERDEAQALARAGERATTSVAAGLPPVVELLSPSSGSSFSQSEVTVRYRLKGKEDVSDLKVYIDGRPMAAGSQRGLKRKSGDTHSISMKLPARDVEISLIAENRFGASAPARARLVWAGGAPANDTQAFVIKPKLYVLAIGVSNYRDDDLDLSFAAKDAKDFARAVQSQGGKLYREVVVKVLPDADSDAVLDGLDWLRREVTSKDIAMLFLAGHGVNDADGDYYFLTSDANTDRIRRTAVPYYEIKKTLSSLPSKTLAFIDTCHSGNVMGGRRAVADINAVVNDLSAAENGVVVFASSTGKQYSLENAEWGNGAFTKALVEGLSGKADYTGDGTITINQLDLYLSERVKRLTGNQQTPTTTKPMTISDFPVVVR